MKTEEDTFNRLRRPAYYDMREIWANSSLFSKVTADYNRFKPFAEEIDAFFKSYGWDVDEYSAYYAD